MSQAILFDRDQVDKLDDLADRPRRLRGDKLLWVDIDRNSPEDAERVGEEFELDSCHARVPGDAERAGGLQRPRPVPRRHDVRAER